jgi:hypothetical protein
MLERPVVFPARSNDILGKNTAVHVRVQIRNHHHDPTSTDNPNIGSEQSHV